MEIKAQSTIKTHHPVGDTQFGILQKGWRIQFFYPEMIKKHKRNKWEGRYVKYKPTGLVFKVLFIHTEGSRTWLHRTEAKYGVIEGFDTKYCKIISKMEYAVSVL